MYFKFEIFIFLSNGKILIDLILYQYLIDFFNSGENFDKYIFESSIDFYFYIKKNL